MLYGYAGRHQQFIQFCRDYELLPTRDIREVDEPKTMYGVPADTVVVLIGTYTDRKDFFDALRAFDIAKLRMINGWNKTAVKKEVDKCRSENRR